MDAPQLLSEVTKALHENDLFDSAPADIMKALQRRADNNSMSFSNIENLRTNLARIQRSPTADGNLKYAAGVIRDDRSGTMARLPGYRTRHAWKHDGSTWETCEGVGVAPSNRADGSG